MTLDLLTKARLKITILYFLLGIIIIAVAGYFIYSDITAIIANILQIVEALFRGQIAANMATSTITQSINAQIKQMDIAIGMWLIIAMVLSAYLLAGITLRPVKRAMERQKRFMGNISHELRTPVSVMKTNMEATLLGGDQLTREELAAAVAGNLEELDRMTEIIEFLLDFSNIENRLDRLAFVDVDMARTAKRVVGIMERFAKEKNITLTLISPEAATLSGNATAIEEMVTNLVKNAITYTPRGGSVTLTVAKKFGSVTLLVEDTGVGISPKDVANIFEAFYRGDNMAIGEKQGSVGLGLAIVQEIAAFHGATISVVSEVGKGTTMSVYFPGKLSRWFALP